MYVITLTEMLQIVKWLGVETPQQGRAIALLRPMFFAVWRQEHAFTQWEPLGF